MYLVAFKIEVVDNGKENPNSVFVSNSGVEFVVVESLHLTESLGHPSSLPTIGFLCENPARIQHGHALLFVYLFPHPIAQQFADLQHEARA